MNKNADAAGPADTVGQSSYSRALAGAVGCVGQEDRQRMSVVLGRAALSPLHPRALQQLE